MVTSRFPMLQFSGHGMIWWMILLPQIPHIRAIGRIAAPSPLDLLWQRIEMREWGVEKNMS